MANLGNLSQAERDEYYRNKPLDVVETDEAVQVLHRLRSLKFWYGLEHPAKVLDIGCKAGAMTRWMLLEPDPPEVWVGIDPQKEAREAFVAWLEQQFPAWRPPAYFFLGTLDEFSSRGETELPQEYDQIVFAECIEHFPEEKCREMLQQIDHLLAPGGRVFLTTPREDGPYGRNGDDPEHITFFNTKTLEQMIRDECRVEEIEIDEADGLLEATWTA